MNDRIASLQSPAANAEPSRMSFPAGRRPDRESRGNDEKITGVALDPRSPLRVAGNDALATQKEEWIFGPTLRARKRGGEPEGSRFLRGVLAAALVLLSANALAQAPAEPDPWPGLVTDIFDGRAVTEHEGFVSLQAPARAEDAAIVPMTIGLEEPASRIRKATLVIDQNPMPMAAAFTFGESAGVTKIETRVRVNSYTNVHLVAETTDGALRSTARFVKASGGCSAPAVKDQDEAKANLGKMKYREFKSADPNLREAQIMIRHPNASGMQMDQLTRLYIPAHYVDKIVVKQGDDLVFAMEGGISLSEDPNFRFTYRPNGAKTMRVEAHDSRGGVFRGEWPIGDAS